MGKSITDIEDLEAIEHNVVHPNTGEDLGAVIVLAGPEHPKRRAALFAQQRSARFKLAKSRGKDPWKAFAEADPEEEEALATEFLVACTLGWRDFIWEGAPLSFSESAARKVYTDPKRAWLRRQVRDRLQADGDFIGASPKA